VCDDDEEMAAPRLSAGNKGGGGANVWANGRREYSRLEDSHANSHHAWNRQILWLGPSPQWWNFIRTTATSSARGGGSSVGDLRPRRRTWTPHWVWYHGYAL